MSVVLAELEHPPVDEPPPSKSTARRRWIALAIVLVIWVIGAILLQGEGTQKAPAAQLTPFQEWLNSVRDWIDQAKFDGNPLFLPFDWISSAITAVVEFLQRLFSTPPFPRPTPEVGWAGVVALAAWTSYAIAGVRIAVITVVSFLLVGLLGFWEDSLDTLIIVSVSVVLCVLIGLPLGVWMARSQRVTAVVTPILDLLQTMPALAYLAPLVLFFGIGSAGAVVVTLMYALPPLVRLTAYGLHTVSESTVEATTSMGSTPQQLLRKVQLPMARRTIIVGLNQTVMAALSMATIAALIDGPGLGKPIVRSLASLNVGAAFVPGICIVILAIMLDRAAERVGERSGALPKGANYQRRRRIILSASGVAAFIAVYMSHNFFDWAKFPETDIGQSIASTINDWNQWVTDNLRFFTKWLYETVTTWLLNPLGDLLANSPWWLVAGVILAIALILGGWGRLPGTRAAPAISLCVGAVLVAGLWANGSLDLTWWVVWTVIIALLIAGGLARAGGALLPTAICLVIIFGVGLWNDTMVTLAMTIVATVLVMILGLAIGVWMGRSRRADQAIRPILDFLQTMPAFVYLVPALALFPPGQLLAIIAAVLYAAPVSIKIVADGIRGVSSTTVEAAESAGSSGWQIIRKVQLPMSRGSIVLAANQGLLFVLSMVVIGALVGGGALGILVVNGLNQAERFGKGLAAGIAITALGVMLDRITVHAAARYGRGE